MTENPASVPQLDAPIDRLDEPATQKPTPEEAARSLTGFDELAIERAFGAEIGAMSGTRSTRAIVFAMRRRAGEDDTAAYNRVMLMSLGEVEDHFAATDDEGNRLPEA